jgi:threonine/homoserine/homoserine lactone efflux protein
MNIPAWLEPFFSGITFGLLLAIMLGPIFFTLLQTSLHEGFKAGVFVAIGVVFSDALIATLCYLFSSLIRSFEFYKTAMSWVGGLLLIGFGIYNFFSRIKLKEVDDSKKIVHAHFALKGFLINALNPAVFFFWLGIVGMISVKDNYKPVHEGIFLGSVLLTVFATDVLKSFVAHKIKDLLKPTVMLWANRTIGFLLVGFGLNMILGIV